MASGETTKRSKLDAAHLVERLQQRAVEQLAGEEDVWVMVDPSELRKPYARAMQDLMQVRRLEGEGTVAGYRTLNALGVGRGGRRGVLYHHVFSSQEEEFLSESEEIRGALDSIGKALTGQGKQVTYIMDSQFDDEAVWGAIWEQGESSHLVCRLKHQERKVEQRKATAGPGESERAGEWEAVSIKEAKGRVVELAAVRTEMMVRRGKQRRAKMQPVKAIVSACPIRVHYQVDVRRRADGPVHQKLVWLVVVQLEGVGWEPWVLLTDWPVVDAASALRVFRMYRQRWAIEDCYKYTKDVLGWEEVQLLNLEGVRTLLALGWVAAGFLYELGVTLQWPEVQLLAKLGGWVERPDRPPGKVIITRGLQRLLNHMAIDAILQEEIARHGSLPPGIAALLGLNSKAS